MYYLQIAVRDSNGYPKGTQSSPNSVANDVTMHAYMMDNIIDFTPAQPTFSTFTERGGQKILSQASMGISELGVANMTLSSFDDVFHALITNSAVDVGSPTGWRQSGFNANDTAPLSFFAIFSMKANSRSGSTLTTKWNHWIYPNCQIRPAAPAGSQNDGTNPNPLSYELVPSLSSRHLTGELFSATDMSLEDNSDFFTRIQTNNRITFTSYTATGSANPETFTTAYKPLTTHATTSDKILTEAGVSDTITAFSVTTGVLTTATAGAAGNVYVVVFETDFVAV
jgi:hypothetical protein